MIEQKPYVITIVGAESSGKTSLAGSLATYFDGVLVPEYAREYLSTLDRAYNLDDLSIISAEEKMRLRDALALDFKSHPSNIQAIRMPEQNFSRIISLISHHKSLNKDSNSKIVVVDGGMLTLRMWARIKYDDVIHEVEDALTNDITDLYLLCRPRREWAFDAMREAPSLVDRSWIYNQYLDELARMSVAFEIVDLN